MKKLTALFLALILVTGLLATPVAANPADKEEALAQREYTYISLKDIADSDVFASWANITDYARFNKSISGATSGYFETTTYNGEIVFNFLPATTYAGTPITGTEDYYYKGFITKNLVPTKGLSSYVMLADDLLYENDTEVTGYRYPADDKTNASIIYSGTERIEAKYTVRASHVVERVDEGGKNYAIISNNGIQHKIGPVDANAYSANSVYLSTKDPVVNVGKTGKDLSILVATYNFGGQNYKSADTAVGAAPKASMYKVTVTYADGETETKYFVMTNGVANKSLSNAEMTIVYAPKKENWTADDLYGANKVTAKILNNENSAQHGIEDVSALTVDDIIFDNPDILMTESANVASWKGNRQDSCKNDYGQRVTMLNLPLEDKEVESFKMGKFFNYIAEEIPTSIPVGTDETQVRQAFIPVTVKGASADYDYFAWVSATTDYCALLGATVVGYSLQEKIDELNERLNKIDVTSITPEECEAFRAEIAQLKEESPYISDEDFNTEKLEQAEKEEILASKTYTYLDINPDRDVFATWEEIAEYSKFNMPVESGKAYNEKTTGGINNQIPETTSNNTPITGNEPYYSKGFGNGADVKAAGYVYLAESITSPLGTTSVKANKIAANDASTNKDYVDGVVTRAESERKFSMPEIEIPLDKDGFVVLNKEEKKFKIGPVKTDKTLSYNARMLTDESNEDPDIITVNEKGNKLDILLVTTDVNTKGYKSSQLATGTAPFAGLQKVVLTYEDGSQETKYVLTSNANLANYSANYTENTVENTIVYAPKKAYDENSFFVNSASNNFKFLTEENVAADGVSNLKITSKMITFADKDIIMSEKMPVADVINNRQDAARLGYGNFADLASIPVAAGKELSTVEFVRNIDAALNSEGAIKIATGTTEEATAALVPVEIAGANDEYVYFAYLGRLADGTFLMGATLTSASLENRIKEIEENIKALDEEFNPDQAGDIIEIYNEINALKAEGAVDADFNSTLLAKINALYASLGANDGSQEARLKTIMENVPEKFSLGGCFQMPEADALIKILKAKGKTEAELKALASEEKYNKTLEYIALYNERIEKINTADRIRIDWEQKNSVTAVDMFEFSTVTSADQIPYKQGIVMAPNNTTHYPSNIGTGTYIGFYTTDLVQQKYGTFPDKFGEYYITNNNVEYGYTGVSEEIGENTYNGGMLNLNNSYEVNFDGVTPYKNLSILAAGTTYFSGSYARQFQAIKYTVYFADGSIKSDYAIVAPYGYGFKIGIYSHKDETYPVSEYLGSRLTSSLDALTWIPKEAKVDTYFNLSKGLSTTNITQYKTSTTTGNANVINIDAGNKAVDRINISYLSEKELEALGGVKYSKFISYAADGTSKENATASYYLPIDKTQIPGYDSSRNYYVSVLSSNTYPVYLHGVTGVKTTPTSYKEDIEEIESVIESLPEEFSIEYVDEIKYVENRLKFIKNQGISEKVIESELLEKFEKVSNYNINENDEYEIHVSPNGDDNALGIEQAPFKTIERARNYARTLANTRPINIIIHEGEYNIKSTIMFSAADSGTKENPVIYKADGNVVITSKNLLKYEDFEKANLKGKVSKAAEDKILMLDLKKYGIDADDIPAYRNVNVDGDGLEDIALYVDSKEQPVSQWPNGEANYDTWVRLKDTTKASTAVQADKVRSKNWQGEKFAYIEGFFSNDYAHERNNITINGDILQFKNESFTTTTESFSRRYKVMHVLSEIDVPGEWYIDRDTDILYYYPTETFGGNSKIEILTDHVNLLATGSNCSNIIFDGITFDKTRGNAVTIGVYSDGVSFYNCKFTNITNVAVIFEGTSNYGGILGAVANYTDAPKNCEIRNNRFVNIGANAVLLKGGERETLTNGNNVVANNYVYLGGAKRKNNPVFSINGMGNYVLNNEMHMLNFHAINQSGNDQIIAYNELYNSVRDTGDCGVIYTGRQFATRGTQIIYNYIHDYPQLDDRTTHSTTGIYLDDRMSGITVEHNILYPNGVNASANGTQNGGGHHNKVNYNTIVDAAYSVTRTNRTSEKMLASSPSSYSAINEIVRISGATEEDTLEVLMDDDKTVNFQISEEHKAIFEKYPEMKKSLITFLNPNESVEAFTILFPHALSQDSGNPSYVSLKADIAAGNDLTKYRLLSLRVPLQNQYTHNRATTAWKPLDTNKDPYVEFGGEFADNSETVSYDDFVDYENQDFRIKKNSDSWVEGVIDEDFDLDTIGVQKDGKVSHNLPFELKDYEMVSPYPTAEEKAFNLTYPQNGAKVKDKKNVELMWERTVGADYYTVEIATDAAMSNIVYKNTDVHYNYLTVTTLPENVDTFYWRVTARNIGRNNKGEWKNADGVKSFTADYEIAIREDRTESVMFDIKADFNWDVFNNFGETHNSSAKLGGKTTTLGMYNLDNFKKLVPENKIYDFRGRVLYSFPQAGYDTNSNNAISTKVYADANNQANYVYKLKDNEKGNFEAIMVAMSAAVETTDYEIKVNYTDGTSDTTKKQIFRYYTTYNAKEASDVILTTDGVNYKGEAVDADNKNKIYQMTIPADKNKTVDSVEFVYGSGTSSSDDKTIIIFAMTGVKDSREEDEKIIKSVILNNYTGKDANIIIVAKGIKDGKSLTKAFTATINKDAIYESVEVEIPKEIFEMTDRKLFVWENGIIKPIAEETNLMK